MGEALKSPNLVSENKKNTDAAAWGDEDFLRAFEDLSFPAKLFHHREHLRVAWLYLKIYDAKRASERMASHSDAGLDAASGKGDGGNA